MHQHYQKIVPKEIANKTLNYLEFDVPWHQIQYYSNKAQRNITTPRFTYVYGYNSNNKKHYQRKIPEPLRDIFMWVVDTFNYSPNFMLLAKYTLPTHGISFHSDDENFIVKNSPIVGINLCKNQNQKTKFKLKNKQTKKTEIYQLTHRDAYYMSWMNQRTHQHSIPKSQLYQEPRYGITFRQGNEYAINNYYKYN